MNVVNVNGFKCRYQLSGNLESNETIVFINGIASFLESWDEMKVDLEQDYKLLGYDLRGQWFSEVTHDTPYSFLTMVEDLNALMETLDIDSAHIVATSLGGEVAQWFAINFPQKVKSLSIIASVSEANLLQIAQVTRWKESAKKAVEMITESDNDEKVRRNAGYDYFQSLLPELYSNAYLEENEENIKEKIEGFLSICNKKFFQGHIYLCDMFFRLRNDEKITDRLHEIKCPALVIAADEDMIKPVKFSQIIADGIPDSRLEVLHGAGHALLHEKGEELVSMVKEFIAQHSNALAFTYANSKSLTKDKLIPC